ncbi:MAG: SDR family oxidoreductase, partial [Rhodobacteraceae bacterium]|nr:SDR family oxidoreductase [Paracoccaceae bacterium]
GLSRKEDGLDLTEPASVSDVFGRLEGPFDLIFVATGILAPNGCRPEKSLASVELNIMTHVMVVNAIGPALILKEVPRLLPRKGRSVTAVLTARVGSIGDNRMGGWYSYRASKAAANQIVRTAAKEAVVVALHPGTVATSFTADYAARGKLEPGVAARSLLSVLDRLTAEQNGRFFDYAGLAVPW